MYFTRNICTTLLYYYSLMIVQETKLGLRLFHGLQQWNLFCPSFDLCLKAYQEEAKTERREGTVVKGTKSNSRNSQKKKKVEAQRTQLHQQQKLMSLQIISMERVILYSLYSVSLSQMLNYTEKSST